MVAPQCLLTAVNFKEFKCFSRQRTACKNEKSKGRITKGVFPAKYQTVELQKVSCPFKNDMFSLYCKFGLGMLIT
jgi:hypothetical protein